MSAIYKGLKLSVIIGTIATVVGLVLPNLDAVRDKARRVKDLENINAIYKAISQWRLASATNGRPMSFEQLVESGTITPDMLVNHETGKPIEYYPAFTNVNGNDVILISRGKRGMNIAGVAGQGLWVDDGLPHDEDAAQVRWTIGIGLGTVLLAGLWLALRIKGVPRPEKDKLLR